MKERKYHTYWPIFLQAIIYAISYVLFKTFCRLTVRGSENVLELQRQVKGGQGIIFAANHSSEWDGPLIRVGLPFFSKLSPMYYVSMKKEGYTQSGWRRYIYGGKFFEMLGAYPVYSGQKDYAYSLQNYIQLLVLHKSVCIFPEGRRTLDGSLAPARGGVAFLSHSTKAPVIPVAVKGLVRLNLRDFILRKRTVEINFGKVIYAKEIVPQENPTIEDFRKGSQAIMERIKEMLV
jgi:1-acyl-sn-glycerol-3-phosphate acyltransferase